MSRQAAASIVGTSFQVALSICQDDLVTTPGAELLPQGVLEERDVCAVCQDQGMVPGTS